MTRLDQSRSEGQIAARVGVNCSQLKNIFVWGNHSPSMVCPRSGCCAATMCYPNPLLNVQVADINHGYVADYPAPGMKTPIVSAVNDSEVQALNYFINIFSAVACVKVLTICSFPSRLFSGSLVVSWIRLESEVVPSSRPAVLLLPRLQPRPRWTTCATGSWAQSKAASSAWVLSATENMGLPRVSCFLSRAPLRTENGKL